MSKRKKKLIFIQSILLITAVLLLYIFYYNDNESRIEKVKIENKKIEELSENNFFEDVEYKGIDANGNRYLLESYVQVALNVNEGNNESMEARASAAFTFFW